MVRWRRLMRGGTLSDLTSQGCADFPGLGVTTVIDLRESGEQDLAPQPACVTSICQVVSVPMPKILPPSEANYLDLMAQSEASVALLFATLGQAGAGPAYIHCVIGRDRASFASALLLLALGSDRAAVLEDFLLSNDAGISVDAAHLEAVLDAIDAEGGIGPYLTRLGVSQAQLDLFRAWALE
jgi:protein-tyrosine phosphatase